MAGNLMADAVALNGAPPVVSDDRLDALVSKDRVGKSASILVEDQEPYRIITANSAWTELCGYSKEEAIGSTTKILQGELTDPSKASEFTATLLKTGKAKTVLVNYNKGGTQFIHALFAKLVESEGESYYLVQGKKVLDGSPMAAAVLCRSREKASFRRTTEQLLTILYLVTFGVALAFNQTLLHSAPESAPSSEVVPHALPRADHAWSGFRLLATEDTFYQPFGWC